MDHTTDLKKLLDSFIAGNEEQVRVSFHTYLSSKIKESWEDRSDAAFSRAQARYDAAFSRAQARYDAQEPSDDYNDDWEEVPDWEEIQNAFNTSLLHIKDQSDRTYYTHDLWKCKNTYDKGHSSNDIKQCIAAVDSAKALINDMKTYAPVVQK